MQARSGASPGSLEHGKEKKGKVLGGDEWMAALVGGLIGICSNPALLLQQLCLDTDLSGLPNAHCRVAMLRQFPSLIGLLEEWRGPGGGY
jgi:hypothetical protein